MSAIEPWRRWQLPAPKSEASRGKLSLIDYEVYSGIEVHDWPFFVRLDGWAFHTLTRRMGLKKPFDRRFIGALVKSAASLFASFNPVFCYVFSDEVNFLFLEPVAFKRVEKIDSVFASLLGARFSLAMKVPAAFDCRVIPVGKRNVIRYLVWRQAECWRNHVNAWSQWVMVERAGLSPREASKELEGLKANRLLKLYRRHGTDILEKPGWQQRGVILYSEKYRKRGYNPLTMKHVLAWRSRVRIDWDPPEFGSAEGRILLRKILGHKKTDSLATE